MRKVCFSPHEMSAERHWSDTNNNQNKIDFLTDICIYT